MQNNLGYFDKFVVVHLSFNILLFAATASWTRRFIVDSCIQSITLGKLNFPLGLRATYSCPDSFLQIEAMNKQTYLYYHVQHVWSHPLYSPRGHHIEDIYLPTVTTKHLITFPLFSYLTHFVTYYFCYCQHQLLSSTFNLLPIAVLI